jgi:hypothetical protein
MVELLKYLLEEPIRFWSLILIMLFFFWGVTSLVGVVLYNMNVKKHGWPPYNMSVNDVPKLHIPPPSKTDEDDDKKLLDSGE